MYPEESVQAAIDAKAEKVMPVHWEDLLLLSTPGQIRWSDSQQPPKG